MWLQYIYGNIFVIYVILFQVTVNSLDGNIIGKNVNKMKREPTRLHFFQMYAPEPTSETKTRALSLSDRNMNKSVIAANQKRQLSRMITKHYEDVYLLYKKRKQFIGCTLCTPHYRSGKLLSKLPSFSTQSLNSAQTSSTPSFIEFYYLDENDGPAMETKDLKRQAIKSPNVFGIHKADHRISAFNLNPAIMYDAFPTKLMNTVKKITTPSVSIIDNLASLTFNRNFPGRPYKYTPQNIIFTPVINSSLTKDLYDIKPFVKLNNQTDINNASNTSSLTIAIIYNNWRKSTTTMNDRIKFFEIYDKHTPLPDYNEEGNLIYTDDINKSVSLNKLNNGQNISLDPQIESFQSTTNHYTSKNITENIMSDSKNLIIEKRSLETVQMLNNTQNKTNVQLNESLSSEEPTILPNSLNKLAVWSENSFMAVYIFEPSQVRCDAAAISPHWLVTSGSCLSRHHKNPSGEGRSAYVAYCRSTWWDTERIAYVKYSVVHPKYHSRDMTRRYMYNIGLVQVINSMATNCPGWMPISLMSHHFISDPDGSSAYTVGWGLDRYDPQFAPTKLPKNPLLIYESQVFSDSCPGNLGYAQVRHEFDPDAVKNVYCLSLPPYVGEDTDPVHGSMLIIQGKLGAIFLQEERRALGHQCAEYTGTWRLGPWIARVAREHDYIELFPFLN